MLYELTTDKKIKRIKRTTLAKIKWKELDLESALVNNIDNFISGNSLMPIFRQRVRQEEPDVMALDSDGNLYIFELKRWEGKAENLLQVLRYGQIFGNSSFKALNNMYLTYLEKDNEIQDNEDEFSDVAIKNVNLTLQKSHQEYFGLEAPIELSTFNTEQNFVVVTNGMDQKSLEAIEYWKKQGIKIDALIYWVYTIAGNSYLEVPRYTPNDGLLDYETSNYILNTNYSNDKESHKEIMKRRIAAAYVSGWKEKIDRLQVGDRVFLYQSGRGIVASGIVNSERLSESWKGKDNNKYYVQLKDFNPLKNPISAKTMKKLKGSSFPFRTTMYSIDNETADKLQNEIDNQKK